MPGCQEILLALVPTSELLDNDEGLYHLDILQ